MDYLHEAFAPFMPHRDGDAALKFALGVLLSDGRLDDLERLVTPGDPVGGIEGEPGWGIHRIETAGEPLRYRARVEPASYALGHPEREVDEHGFWTILWPLLGAVARLRPDTAERVAAIRRRAPSAAVVRPSAPRRA